MVSTSGIASCIACTVFPPMVLPLTFPAVFPPMVLPLTLLTAFPPIRYCLLLYQ